MERTKYESDENTGIATTLMTEDRRTASPATGTSYQPQVSAMQQILSSQLQLFQAQAGAGGQPGAPLSWMAPYQMMMLPGSAVPQPLFLQSNGAGGVFTMHDGQVYVTPISDGSGSNMMPIDASGNCMVPMASAEAASSNQDRGGRDQKAEMPKPPKKPLTPYMIFSKQIWPQVKAEHAHLSSVTELGAIVGQLWRELDPGQKQRFNELYAQDKTRYDEELTGYLKLTGLVASDVAKMRTKRSHGHRPSQAAANAAKIAAAASTQGWPNGGVVKQAAGSGAVPTLYANHDGTITVGGATAAGMVADHKPTAYSDAQGAGGPSADGQRSWAWHHPLPGMDGSSGMVMYQLPQGDQGAAAAASGSEGQIVYNGIPGSGAATDSKAWYQSGVRVEQLEAEVQRLRAALSEKTREAQNLRSELNNLGAVLHSIEERRRNDTDGLQTMSNAAELQHPIAMVENNNTAKADMPATATTVVNGLPE